MMTRYAFEVPGPVRGKQRARAGNGRHFTPPATVNAEAWVRHCAVAAGVRPIVGPVRMDLTSVRPAPASWSKAKREAAGEWDTRKPDRDNIEKLVADALNGIAYADDAQIVAGEVEKRLSATGQEKLVVILTALTEQPD
jgi:Holliday junction resolvase RusA-like endonuclease